MDRSTDLMARTMDEIAILFQMAVRLTTEDENAIIICFKNTTKRVDE